MIFILNAERERKRETDGKVDREKPGPPVTSVEMCSSSGASHLREKEFQIHLYAVTHTPIDGNGIKKRNLSSNLI